MKMESQTDTQKVRKRILVILVAAAALIFGTLLFVQITANREAQIRQRVSRNQQVFDLVAYFMRERPQVFSAVQPNAPTPLAPILDNNPALLGADPGDLTGYALLSTPAYLLVYRQDATTTAALNEFAKITAPNAERGLAYDPTNGTESAGAHVRLLPRPPH